MPPCPTQQQLAALASGSASQGTDNLQRHVATCPACAKRVAAQAASMADTTPPLVGTTEPSEQLAPGETVDRYMIVRRVGRGGMGEVYCANDPGLNRNVALKLVRTGRSTEHQQQLVREAQAMAQLSHPNVVTVHDVGTIDGRAFIAMELVEGDTLGGWLRKSDRDWREIINAFVSAGNGLAAAHSAGVVHRDFKPSNVLVDEHGTARVTDFGIAHHASSVMAEASSGDASHHGSSTGFETSDSLASNVHLAAGTPAYMSPEQHLQQPTTDRSDQFSFCVALYAALYGARPFAGSMKKGTLARNVLGGRLRAPEASRTPRAVFRIVERGLRVEPSERYDSMAALLLALQRIVARARRRATWAAGAVVVAVAGASGWAVQSQPAPHRATCGGGDALVSRVWNAETQAAVRESFAATELPYAAQTWGRVEASLAEFERAFVAAHRQACEATRVHGTQADEVLTLRMACLNDRLADVEALLEIFQHADKSVVDEATQATLTIEDLRSCQETRVVEDRVQAPPVGLSARVDEAMARWRHANMLFVTGKWSEAQQALEALLPVADEIDYAPLTAKINHVAAMTLGALGEGVTAEEAAERAMLAAHSAGDRRTAVAATVAMADIIGAIHPKRMNEALRWTRQADAIVDTMTDEPSLRGVTSGIRGGILMGAGRGDEALPHFDNAIELLESTPNASNVDLGEMYTNRGNALTDMGRFEQSTQAHLKSVALLTAAVGQTHPRLIRPIHNLAAAYAQQGEHHRAVETFIRGCGLAEQLWGPDNYKVALCLTNWSISLHRVGDLAAARSTLERALHRFQSAVGEDALPVGIAQNNLGEILGAQGHYDQAESRLSRAHKVMSNHLGVDHPSVASNLMSWGRVRCDRGQCAEALPDFTRALSIQEKALGPTHFELADTLTGLARAELAVGQVAAAQRSAQRAVDIADASPRRLQTQGRARIVLGQVLWAVGSDKKLAIATAERGSTLLREGTGNLGEDTLEQRAADRWLSEHRSVAATSVVDAP